MSERHRSEHHSHGVEDGSSRDRHIVENGLSINRLSVAAWCTYALLVALVLALSISVLFTPNVAAQSGPYTRGPDAAPFSLDGARLATIDGPITAVTLDYLERSIQVAENENAGLVIALNTPGGNVSSMRTMTERMLSSEVPVLVWVGPQGGQAASAGTFIVLAAHVAGMAPRTTIGAASPVGSGGDDLPDTIKSKLTEDLSALARTYAERRGEPAAEWAQAAVRDAVSATADEALELGLIDAVVDSPAGLVAAADGLVVILGEASLTLSAPASDPESGAVAPALNPIEFTSAEQLLSFLAHPAVALLLLTLGVNALLIELSNPGGFVAGIVGVSALALGFYSLGALDANFVGLAFIVGAIALFVLELKTPTSGLFTVAGLALFVAGAVVLFSGTPFGVPWPTVLGTAGFTTLFVLFVVGAALRAMGRQPVTGFEGLIGQRAEVRRALDPRGQVLVAGELWDAVLTGSPSSDGEAEGTTTIGVPKGDSVVIEGRDHFVLKVRRT